MIPYWLLFGFGGIVLFLSVPIKIMVNGNPGLKSEISWIFLKVRFVLAESDLSVSYHLFNYPIKKGKSSSKNTATTTNRKKEKRGKITLSLVKDLINHSSTPRILKRALYIFQHLLNSFSIKRVRWDISIDDYFIQGMLQGLLSGLPQTRRIAIKGNFEEINAFSLKAHLSILKILGTFFLFVVTFPYLDSMRLYRKVKTIA